MKFKLFVFLTVTGFLCAYVAAVYAFAYTFGLILANFYWEYLGVMT